MRFALAPQSFHPLAVRFGGHYGRRHERTYGNRTCRDGSAHPRL